MVWGRPKFKTLLGKVLIEGGGRQNKSGNLTFNCHIGVKYGPIEAKVTTNFQKFPRGGSKNSEYSLVSKHSQVRARGGLRGCAFSPTFAVFRQCAATIPYPGWLRASTSFRGYLPHTILSKGREGSNPQTSTLS